MREIPLRLLDESWLSKLIQETHDYVDEQRKLKGLKPWKWEIVMVMSARQLELRAKYPFIVNLDREVYTRELHENIIIEQVSVIVPKNVCAKCGDKRHTLDTRGFCIKCKVQLGIPVNPKSRASVSVPTTKTLEVPPVELVNNVQMKPTPGKQPSCAVVSEEFVNFAWENLL